MKNHTMYQQCRFSKAGHDDQVAFIPQKFANIGAFLKFQKPNGEWDNGWRVESVGFSCLNNELRNNEHTTYRAKNDY